MKLKQWLASARQSMQEQPIGTLLTLLLGLLAIILLSLYYRVYLDDEHWEKFKVEHHCELRISKTGTQRASWACDDGKTYFRWRQQR
ncbi:hypothetical protein [Methylomicrobium lacus]|uniref:hypothetical protein n=1 Tax=Methylomicrobium lacus TaxID=136992 RepID=UPI00045EA9E2|nr:hypothetical protein [Methylomicrobium lacus]